ncbi:hypothetical protein SteCoe_116 [Stentor coeruleus]|uniref:Uncharacterized protein n=1 Tax=Stentor coeruleus TaxID=5963 RepID=A0A1R2D514_9CILI|nr:hypothetical protein SteCoe_116 [Stentor coeruleus]
MSGIVLFQVKTPVTGVPKGIFIELYGLYSENLKEYINFSTSAFVKNRKVVTCTDLVSMFLDDEAMEVLYKNKVVKEPKSSGFFYFSYMGWWIPLKLECIKYIENIENHTKNRYFICYFLSEKYNLPEEIRDKGIVASPLGLLSQEIFVNLKMPSEYVAVIDKDTKIVKMTSFPGCEGAFCDGWIIVPSRYYGYSISCVVPKL